jgi:hypothetical protein
MDTKLFARIGAGAFVAIALTMSVLQLREERPEPLPEVITVFEPDGDPLPGTAARLRGDGRTRAVFARLPRGLGREAAAVPWGRE